LLAELESARIHFTLNRVREDTVMIEAAVPGRHYEIEVFSDESVEVEVYTTDGNIGGQEVIDDLLARLSDTT
jgi:hypothetical protein